MAATLAVAVSVVANLLPDGDGGNGSPDEPSNGTSSAIEPLPDTVALVVRNGLEAIDLQDFSTVGRREGPWLLPTVTPDRRTVVVLRQDDETGGRVPFVLDADAETARAMPSLGPAQCATMDRPAFSPSGAQIAAVCDAGDAVPTLHVANVAVDDAGRLVGFEATRPVPVPAIDAAGARPMGSPTWFNEETVLVLALDTGGDPGDGATALWRVPLRGGDATVLADAASPFANPDDASTTVIVSPDVHEGRLLVLTGVSRQRLQIRVADLADDGRSLQDAETWPTRAVGAAWSPDGSRIAALMGSRAARELVLLDDTLTELDRDGPYAGMGDGLAWGSR